ncbi:MAG: flexitail domain-containing putative surface protein [Solirubrobacterales bacterium]
MANLEPSTSRSSRCGRLLQFALAITFVLAPTWTTPASAHLEDQGGSGFAGDVLFTLAPSEFHPNPGGTPGIYIHCRGVINGFPGNSISSQLFCYWDSPFFTVNYHDAGNQSSCPPAPAARCGDGYAGSPPPNSWVSPETISNLANVDDARASLSGTYSNNSTPPDPSDDTIVVEGCFDGLPNTLLGPNMYVKATLANAPHPSPVTATADIFLNQPNCSPPGSDPDFDDIPVDLTEGGHTNIPPKDQWDPDLDGCSVTQELRPSEAFGGRRDPYSFWDLYDVPQGATLARDRSVSGGDIAAVVTRFGSNDSTAGDFDHYDDPLSTPNQTAYPSGVRANYHPAFDRGAGFIGGIEWTPPPAGGSISGGDIVGVNKQFGHNCLQ